MRLSLLTLFLASALSVQAQQNGSAAKPPARPWFGTFEGVSNFRVRHVLVVDGSSLTWTEYEGSKSNRCAITTNMDIPTPPTTLRNGRWNCEGASPSNHSLTFNANERTWTIVEGAGNLVERVTLRIGSTSTATGCVQSDAERELLTAVRSRVHNFEATLGRSTTWTQNRGECSWTVTGMIGWKDPMGTPNMSRFGATVMGDGKGRYQVYTFNLM